MSKRKSILTAVAVVMLCAISIAGTMAYLQKTAPVVTNTFTSSEDLILNGGEFVVKEHLANRQADGTYLIDDTQEVNANAYTVLPGVDVPKDPFVRIDRKSDTAAYLYVEVVNQLNANFDYTLTSDWTLLPGITGANGGLVYVYQNGALVDDSFGTSGSGTVQILADNTVGVADVALSELAVDTAKTINFYGYLAQATAGATASEAYTNCF